MKLTCKRGHILAGDNLSIVSGRRICRACHKFRNSEYRKRHPKRASECTKEAKRNLLYGLSPKEYKRLLAHQKGLCAICRNPETHKVRGYLTSLSVDHNHITGLVRGLLCRACNRAIGMLKDDPQLCENARKYLLSTDGLKP